MDISAGGTAGGSGIQDGFRAAENGISLKQLFQDALEDKLQRGMSLQAKQGPPWMQGFGALVHLRKENERIRALIEDEFKRLEPGDDIGF